MMRSNNFVRRNGKKALAITLGAAMVGGLLNIIAVQPMCVSADSFSFEEDFDTYEDASEKKGSSSGSPAYGLRDHGEGKALTVTERSNGFFGYKVDLMAFRGNTIHLSADVAAYNESDEASTLFNATIKIQKDGQDDIYDCLADATAEGNAYKKLEGDYVIPADCDECYVYFETDENIDYAIDNISITTVGDYVQPSNVEYADYSGYAVLKNHYIDYFKIGVECESISNSNDRNSEIGNLDKEALIKQTFNSVTLGNELMPEFNMDWDNSTEDDLVFAINPSAKEMLDWAKDNSMPVRGHTLICHSQCPDQIFCKNYSPVYLDEGRTTLDPSCFVDAETMKKRMESYIYHVMEYMYANGYGEIVYAWDVVNEAIEPGANEDDMRESYWYQIMGKEYLADAFHYAREAVKKYSKEYAECYGMDPNDNSEVVMIQPKLIYNDYNEFVACKRDAILKAVAPIVERGDIDGIGMQAHLTDTTNINDFITALNMYSDAVGEVQITELDVAQTSIGAKGEYYQGLFYYDLFKALKDVRDDGANLTSVTIWGLTDDHSWKTESSPLLFNSNLSYKSAFLGIVNAMTGDVMPAASAEKGNFMDGLFSFDEDNLLLNRTGFEAVYGGTMELQTEDAYTNSGALVLKNRTDRNSGIAYDISRYAGKTISVSAWVKCGENTVQILSEDPSAYPIGKVGAIENGWKQLSGTYEVPAEGVSKIIFNTENGTDDLYLDNVEVKLIEVKEDFEDASHAVKARNVDHVPQLEIVDTCSYAGDNSLKVSRTEQEASVKMDIREYAGRKIAVSARVRTEDSKIYMGFDGDSSMQLAETDSGEDFTEISSTFVVPTGEATSDIYFETDGTADFYLDDITITIADTYEDLEDGNLNFTAREDGVGTVELSQDNGVDDSNAVCLRDREESNCGIAYDVSNYLGMQVEISFDVRTDDEVVKLNGDIDGSYPNYVTAKVEPGNYTHVATVVNLPDNLSSLKVYVETDGKSDLYLDNFSIKRVASDTQYKVSFASAHNVKLPKDQVVNKNNLIVYPGEMEEEGLIFNGWFMNEDCTIPLDIFSERIDSDTVIYAGFEVDPELAAVEALIDQVLEIDPEGEIDVTDDELMQVVKDANEAFNELADSLKLLIDSDKVSTFETIVAAVDEAKINFAKDCVDLLRERLDDLTASDEDGEIVNNAIIYFNRLTSEQQEEVGDVEEINTLLDTAKAKYDNLVAVKNVVDLIEAIGEVNYNSNDAISEARTQYDALTAEQKAIIDQDVVAILINAELEYEDALKAHAVTLLVDNLEAPENITLEDKTVIQSVRDEYNNLTVNQKKYVSDSTLEKLELVEQKWNDLKAAKDVTDKILAIEDVTADDESKKAIDEAEAAYNQLTENQKAYVTAETRAALEGAKTTYDTALAEKVAAVAAEQARKDKENNDKAAAAAVVRLIDQVKVTDKASIDAARTAYNALTVDQKRLVGNDDVRKLTNAEDAYKSLEESKKPASSEEVVDNSKPTVKVDKVKGLKLTKKKVGKLTKLTVKFNKVDGCKYEIQISTDKKFKKNVKKKTTSKTKYTYSKNYKGKRVYVRVRAFKTVNGKKITGIWSAKKNVKSYK